MMIMVHQHSRFDVRYKLGIYLHNVFFTATRGTIFVLNYFILKDMYRYHTY